MKLSGNTVLITGGSSGIGKAMAERFVALGNDVIVTGRREAPLRELAEQQPGLHVKVNDAGNPSDRAALAEWVVSSFPKLNVLINNAGIQRKVDVQQAEPWADTASELDINLGGPIHLCQLLVPHLRQQAQSHIMNVSSGLAFVPIAHMPVYCATKAALHSFTLSLREQLKDSSIAVTEIIPPAVKTNLGGAHDFGEELADYVHSVFLQLETNQPELTFGMSARASQLSRADADLMFRHMNGAGRG